MLEAARTGPVWLKDPRIAAAVVETIRYGETVRRFYKTLAYVVLVNHVHLLIGNVAVPIAAITKCLKGYTARYSNKILGRTGQPFWQDESFDHWVRNCRELRKIIDYIESNPVKAGLVSRPEQMALVQRVEAKWLTRK